MNQAIITKRQLISMSYILGAMCFLHFAGQIGDNGVGYLALVIELLCVFVFFVSEEITDFVSKMIRGKKSKGLYRDAYNVRRRVLVIHFITGVVLSLLFLGLSEFFAVTVFKIPYIGICVRVMTPVIFLRSMETAFLGSFQSSGSQMPAVVCAFLRQIFFFIFSFFLVPGCMDYGKKVSALLVNKEYAGMYGAMGLCVSIVLTEALVFLFQLFLFLISDRKREQKRVREGLQTTEDLKTTLYYYYEKSFIIFLSQICCRLPLLMGIGFSLRSLTEPFGAAYDIGGYYGTFLVLCSIPVILVEMGTYVMQSRLAYYCGKGEGRSIREVIAAGIHYSVIMAVFLGMIFLTLPNQMTVVFMGSADTELVKYMRLCGVLVIAAVLSNLGLGLIRSMNQKRFVLLCSFLGAVAALITCFVGMKKGFSVYDYMFYPTLAAFIVCALAAIVLVTFSRRIGMEQLTVFGVPILCGSVVGLLVILISSLMTPHLGNLVCFLLCLVFGFIIYIFLLGITRNIQEDEISIMYGEIGKRIVGLIFK